MRGRMSDGDHYEPYTHRGDEADALVRYGQQLNVVAPGTTDTGMLTRFTSTAENKAALVSTLPVKRLAAPEEIAHVIACVASAHASTTPRCYRPVCEARIADRAI